MTHTYHINGMSCNDCKTHVEQALRKVYGVNGVTINLQKEEAVIEMPTHIPIEKFQEGLKNSGGNYTISFPEPNALRLKNIKQ